VRQDTVQWRGSSRDANGPLGFIKDGEFFDELSDF
jgi:hypothetical protein